MIETRGYQARHVRAYCMSKLVKCAPECPVVWLIRIMNIRGPDLFRLNTIGVLKTKKSLERSSWLTQGPVNDRVLLEVWHLG